MRLPFTVFTLVALTCTTAAAEISVRFVESAPKDRFVIENTGECELTGAMLAIDLEPSLGQLIVDATAEGAGVEVFQPLEVAAGAQSLGAVAPATDGDTILRFEINSLSPNDQIIATLDLDDQMTQSDLGQIRISGSEIEGAVVTLTQGDVTTQTAFGPQPRLILASACML